MSEDCLAALRSLLPANAVSTDPARLAPRLVDERGRYHGQALALVLPGNVDEAAAVVRCCRAHSVIIVPQAGNTGLVGGATPNPQEITASPHPAVVLGCDRLDRVREIDAAGWTMTVEAGVVLDTARAAAEAQGCLFPMWLGSSGSARIGGLIATNAGGLQVQRYGTMRELTLGLEAVLPDGRVLRALHALRKRNVGFDLKQLLIGTEGSFGFITAATLRLFPPTPGQALALVALPDSAALLALFSRLRTQLGEVLTAFELMGAPALALMAQYYPDVIQPWGQALPPWAVLVELSGAETDAVLATRLTDALYDADAWLAQDSRQRAMFWALRERIPSAQRRAGPSVKHDLALPIGQIPAFIEAAAAAIAKCLPRAQPVVFGHLGDGNLHYNLGLPADLDFASAEAQANACLFALAQAHGGDLSAEHGLGRLRVADADALHDPVARALMREMKAWLDPDGVFNPGVMV